MKINWYALKCMVVGHNWLVGLDDSPADISANRSCMCGAFKAGIAWKEPTMPPVQPPKQETVMNKTKYILTPLDAVRNAVDTLAKLKQCPSTCDNCRDIMDDVQASLHYRIVVPADLDVVANGNASVIGLPAALWWQSCTEALQLRADFEANMRIRGQQFEWLPATTSYKPLIVNDMWIGFQLGRTPTIKLEPKASLVATKPEISPAVKSPCNACNDLGYTQMIDPPTDKPCAADGCTAYSDQGYCDDEGCDHHGTVHICINARNGIPKVAYAKLPEGYTWECTGCKRMLSVPVCPHCSMTKV